MITRHRVSGAALRRYAADKELAGRLNELLAAARGAEDVLRQAEASGVPLAERRERALAFDRALTAAMRAAYAAERAQIGPRGYDDWIYRRKAKAKPKVRILTAEAERLLTLRETHRLTGIPPAPQGSQRDSPAA